MKFLLRCLAGLTAASLSSMVVAGPAVYPKVKPLMTDIVSPASQGLFAVAKNPPVSEEEWLAVERSALTLVDAGKKLKGLAPVRSAVWRTQTRLLTGNAGLAAAAAGARDLEALNKASEAVFETCAGCHKAFPVSP